MYQEENKESQGGHGSCPCARSIPFRLLRSGSAWLGDSHAQTPCRLFSWKLNWIVTLCEHQAAGSKLSYFPAWSGCSSLVPSWSLFNLQFSFISSSILASQSGFFSPRLSTRFHSLGTVARSLPVQAIPKLSQVGNSNRTQTLPCLSGACRLSPLGAERLRCFHRPVFLLRGLAALLPILRTRWNHWGLPQRKPLTKTVPVWTWFLSYLSITRALLLPRKIWNFDKFLPQLDRLSRSLHSS